MSTRSIPRLNCALPSWKPTGFHLKYDNDCINKNDLESTRMECSVSLRKNLERKKKIEELLNKNCKPSSFQLGPDPNNEK